MGIILLRKIDKFGRLHLILFKILYITVNPYQKVIY